MDTEVKAQSLNAQLKNRSWARGVARWMDANGFTGIQIIESYPSGECYLKAYNRVGNERLVRDADEYARLKKFEG